MGWISPWFGLTQTQRAPRHRFRITYSNCEPIQSPSLPSLNLCFCFGRSCKHYISPKASSLTLQLPSTRISQTCTMKKHILKCFPFFSHIYYLCAMRKHIGFYIFYFYSIIFILKELLQMYRIVENHLFIHLVNSLSRTYYTSGTF